MKNISSELIVKFVKKLSNLFKLIDRFLLSIFAWINVKISIIIGVIVPKKNDALFQLKLIINTVPICIVLSNIATPFVLR